MTPQINLLVIRTNQPKALAAFYTLLGMEFQYHRHGNGPYHYSTELNGFVFEIYPLLKSQTVADKSLRLGFTVNNLEELVKILEKYNTKILKIPTKTEWGFQAIITDLDGRKIELTQI